MDILIIDVATTLTMLHEKIALSFMNSDFQAGILYFNKKKFNKSPIPHKFFIDFRELKESTPELDNIYVNIEKQTGITLSRALYLDRFNTDKKKLKKIYNGYLLKFKEIIKNETPKTVIGELSLGWEILSYGFCKMLKINYFLPMNVYVFPKPRLAFFNINHDIEIIRRISNCKCNELDFNEIFKLYSERKSVDINKNFGEKLRKNIDSNTFHRIFYNLKNLDFCDCRENIINKFYFRLKNIIHAKLNKYYLSKFGVNHLSNNFFLVLLHIQPEVTPDTTATFFSNQYELIRQIALRLPYKSVVYVKLHPNGLGSTPISMLKKITALPNTQLLNLDISANDAIQKSNGVITIAGTGSFEAALHGRKSAVFNTVYFSEYPGISKLNTYSDLDNFLRSKKIDSEYDNKKVIDFFETLYNGTFNCFWHQPFRMDGVLEDANIESIKQAIIFTHKVYSK